MGEPSRLWHVTLTVAGDLVEPRIVRNALSRLRDQRAFLHSLRYAGERAEVQYWDEADSLLDASSLALRVWNEYRDSAGLPRWEVSASRCSSARSSRAGGWTTTSSSTRLT